MKKSDHWLESRWLIAKSQIDVFVSLLDQLGALGSFENLDLDSEKENLKTTSELVAYFPDRSDLDSLKSLLAPFQNTDIELKTIERIPYGDWATAWKEYFHPFHLTPQIVICPSWETYQSQNSEHVVILDPGMAFGTGQHDTTRFCAEFLCEIQNRKAPYNTVLDVGCGSGILSFIAKKMGAKTVCGIDNDQHAIETSIENLDRNPQLKPIDFLYTNGAITDVVHEKYDVVVANIIAEALCDLKSTLTQLVESQGHLILSGILPERVDMVKSAFKNCRLLEEKSSSSWHTLLYQL